MITVGIHENLSLTQETKINDKGSLELAIASGAGEDAALAALMGNTTIQKMSGKMLFYPPNTTTWDKKPKEGADILNDFLKLRGQLMCYAGVYGTQEEVSSAIGGLALFDGLGVTPENLSQAVSQLTNEDFLSKVYAILVNKFVDFLKAKNAFNSGVTFRQKFLRQSKAKHWAVIPSSSFDVWIEPMTVPKDQSKVAFTKWEMENGKNDGTPVAASNGEASTAENQNKANALFSAPAATPAPATPAVGDPTAVIPPAGTSSAGPDLSQFGGTPNN